MSKVDPRAVLEKVGGGFFGAFGDRILIGVLMGFLDDETPGKCYERITKGKELFDFMSDEDWKYYADKAKNMDLKDTITLARITKELRRHRPDLLGVIINTPGGTDWLKVQVDSVRKKLGISE